MLTAHTRAEIAEAVQRLAILTTEAPEAHALVEDLSRGLSMLYLSEAVDEQIHILDSCAGSWDQEDVRLEAMTALHALIRDGAKLSPSQTEALQRHGWNQEQRGVESTENIRKFVRKIR